MGSLYYERFIRTVLDHSESSTWENAVEEWDIVDCEEDLRLKSACICGKEQLRYLFTIRNRLNGDVLRPIGSSCINKFGRSDLDSQTMIQESLFKLYHAIEENQFITLTPEFFSRKVLRALYEQGALDSYYNNFDGTQDYDFLIKMFNKRDRDSVTYAQNQKIKAIIVGSIRPFLVRNLSNKSH